MRRVFCRMQGFCTVRFFVSAVIKIQGFLEVDLKKTEKQKVKQLLIELVDVVKLDTESDSIVCLGLKRLLATMTTKASEYMNMGRLVPTSNYCERLFWIFVHVLSNRGRKIQPKNFESQMFSYINDSYWGIGEVKTIVSGNSNPDSSKSWSSCSAV